MSVIDADESESASLGLTLKVNLSYVFICDNFFIDHAGFHEKKQQQHNMRTYYDAETLSAIPFFCPESLFR